MGIFSLYHSDSTENTNSQSIKNNFLYYFLDIDLLRVEQKYTRPLRKVILLKEHEDNKKNSFNNCRELRRKQRPVHFRTGSPSDMTVQLSWQSQIGTVLRHSTANGL